jgi:hypothetical protein
MWHPWGHPWQGKGKKSWRGLGLTIEHKIKHFFTYLFGGFVVILGGHWIVLCRMRTVEQEVNKKVINWWR